MEFNLHLHYNSLVNYNLTEVDRTVPHALGTDSVLVFFKREVELCRQYYFLRLSVTLSDGEKVILVELPVSNLDVQYLTQGCCLPCSSSGS